MIIQESYLTDNDELIKVTFDDLQYGLLQVISVHDKIYECRGYDEKGNNYSGIATFSCDEFLHIEDIEPI